MCALCGHTFRLHGVIGAWSISSATSFLYERATDELIHANFWSNDDNYNVFYRLNVGIDEIKVHRSVLP